MLREYTLDNDPIDFDLRFDVLIRSMNSQSRLSRGFAKGRNLMARVLGKETSTNDFGSSNFTPARTFGALLEIPDEYANLNRGRPPGPYNNKDPRFEACALDYCGCP